MAFSVTNIGTQSSATYIDALAAITVPVGSVIALAVNDRNPTTDTMGTVADATSNVYNLITNKAPNNSAAANGTGGVYYCLTVSALTIANVITYTGSISMGSPTSMSGFYITGAASSSPLDTSVTNTAFGSSAAPSVTSGTPGTSGELIVAAVITNNTGYSSFSQAAGWAAPFTAVQDGVSGNAALVGGNLVNAGSGTKTYAPTIGNAPWSNLIFGFKPAATTATGVALFAGAGALNAAASNIVQGAAKFAGVGALNANAIPTMFTGANFAGVGSLKVADFVYNFSYANFAGVGALNAADVVFNFGASAIFQGAGLLNANAVGYVFGSANFAGAGALNANAGNFVFGSANFQGVGALNASSFPFNFTGAFFQGVGQLNDNGAEFVFGVASFQGSGALNAFGYANPVFTGAAFFGSGLLSAGTTQIPPPPTRYAIKNIFATQLVYSVQSTDNFYVPNPSLPPVKVYQNEPAHLMLRVQHPPTEPVYLFITRPDGTSYYVDGSNYYAAETYIFTSVLRHGIFIDYTSAVGEFNQMGWWLAQYIIGDSYSQQFSFYITPLQ